MRNLGHRGQGQLIIAAIWLFVGIGEVVEPEQHPGHLWSFYESLAPWMRCGLWVVPALFALVTAWWPPGRDRSGFVALVIPPALRAMSDGWVTLLGLLPGDIGDTHAWVGFAAWALAVVMVYHVATEPELPKLDRRRGRGGNTGRRERR